MGKTKVSVIVPVYNAEDTIKRAIESVPVRDDVETIVIDDGSTDKTREIAEKAIKGRGRVYYKPNGGVSSALNMGLDFAKGEYVVFLGSDDYFYTDEFEKAMKKLDGTDLVYFALRINSGVEWYLNEDNKMELCGSVKFMRREFIGEQRNDESKLAGEDLLFNRELQAKNPTEKFTNLVVKHYNYPRKGSLYDKLTKGEI